MTDPRFIPPSDREPQCDCGAVKFTEHSSDCTIFESPDHQDLLDHASYMDERDARQRDLIRRLAEFLDRQELVIVDGEYAAEIGAEFDALVAEARGIEVGNE